MQNRQRTFVWFHRLFWRHRKSSRVLLSTRTGLGVCPCGKTRVAGLVPDGWPSTALSVRATRPAGADYSPNVESSTNVQRDGSDCWDARRFCIADGSRRAYASLYASLAKPEPDAVAGLDARRHRRNASGARVAYIGSAGGDNGYANHQGRPYSFAFGGLGLCGIGASTLGPGARRTS